ncbi:putative RND superfamily exporter protein [Weissella uvarum]|uniref:MMPL family transporter n=1 Tax=Weissella uvarum TaxID=1479233 RepID=UPI001EF7F996|nr:MMPL family transporter [Weissella uvarum]MBM7616803.1 putative RND superfamily exporter protein [Weissella uvarum]
MVKSDDVRDKKQLTKVDNFAQKIDHKYSGIEDATTLKSTYEALNPNMSDQSQRTINSNINNLPTALKQITLSKDNHYTVVSFKVKTSLSTEDQRKLMSKIDKQAKDVKGINIAAAGPQMLMLTGVGNMTARHALMIIAGLSVIVVVLLLVYRSFKFALLPVIPIVVVLGLSPLTLYLLGDAYNPLTVALSSLVLGIGTEFTILILERYREEKMAGLSTQAAVTKSLSSVGSAITVSGLTVVGGFAAIMFANFPALSAFGLITVLDTAYSLISALTILPAMIILFDKLSKKKQG